MWNFNMKKYILYVLISLVLIASFFPIVKMYAESPNPPLGNCINKGVMSPDQTEKDCRASSPDAYWVGYYYLLAPFPKVDSVFNPSGTNALGTYLNLMLEAFIGICAVLSVIMIVIGGIEYMTSELISGKEEGKERIREALLGLLIALGSYALLNTINPDLLNSDPSIKDISVEGSIDQPQEPVNGRYANGAIYGAVWNDTVGKTITTLPAGVTTNHPGQDCSTIGQQNCTSLRGLDLKYINTIKANCTACANLVITGGTESWLHGGRTGNTSHMLGSPTVDLQPTPQLDNYIKSGTNQGNNRYLKDGISYLYENNNGVIHWHAGP